MQKARWRRNLTPVSSFRQGHQHLCLEIKKSPGSVEFLSTHVARCPCLKSLHNQVFPNRLKKTYHSLPPALPVTTSPWSSLFLPLAKPDQTLRRLPLSSSYLRPGRHWIYPSRVLPLYDHLHAATPWFHRSYIGCYLTEFPHSSAPAAYFRPTTRKAYQKRKRLETTALAPHSVDST